MNIKATEIKSIEYTQTLTDADLQRYLADPWQWREDVRAQLGLDAPANGNGHSSPTGRTTKRAAAKRAAKRAAKKAAPKGTRGQKVACPDCGKMVSSGQLGNHRRHSHPTATTTTPTWEPSSADGVK